MGGPDLNLPLNRRSIQGTGPAAIYPRSQVIAPGKAARCRALDPNRFEDVDNVVVT
jgi:hypothetical protein